MQKIFLCVCVLAVTAGFFTPHSAWALLDGLLQRKQVVQQVPLSQIYPVQDEETFQGVAKSFHGTPFNDPQLEFEVMLPKDWTYEQTAQVHDAYGLSRELMGALARFKSPRDRNHASPMPSSSPSSMTREVSAENWLKNFLFTTGCDLFLQDTVVPS